MSDKIKIVISLIFAISLILILPTINPIVKTCSGNYLCGIDITSLLDFLSGANSTAFAFGNYLYQKLITGAVVFVLTLTLAHITHNTITQNNAEKIIEEIRKEDDEQSIT